MEESSFVLHATELQSVKNMNWFSKTNYRIGKRVFYGFPRIKGIGTEIMSLLCG